MGNAGIGIGAALASLGQSGIGFGNQVTQMQQRKKDEEKKAPYQKLNLELLKQATERGTLEIDEKKHKASVEKDARTDMENLRRLLSKPAVREELSKIGAVQGGGGTQGQQGVQQPQASVPGIGGSAPTLQEQLGRLKGTEFEMSPHKEIQDQVSGLRERYAQQQAPVMEQQKFERDQGGKIELQELRGEQAINLEEFKSGERQQLEQLKRETKDVKKEQQNQDINAGIEAVLTLASGVDPQGRAIGYMAKVGKWVGWNPKLSSMDNTAGLLAGQVAKKIGGESGRLTDQDRIYALRVMPKSTDTKREREIKVAVLETFQDPNVSGESIRSKLIQAMSGLAEIDSKKYELVDEKGNSVELQSGTATQIQSDDEYDKLPSGAAFIDPNGIRRRKP